MNRARVTTALLLFIAGTTAVAARAAVSRQGGDPQGLALSHFEQRVKDYLALREKIKASLIPPKPTHDPDELTVRQHEFAREVRAARGLARQGDIFIPEVAPTIRKVIRDDFARRTPHERAAALQEVPVGLRLKVDEEYPKSVPLATVPPKLIAAMPPLPDGLEYRFVGRRLILHDTLTNLVVDILENAVPRR